METKKIWLNGKNGWMDGRPRACNAFIFVNINRKETKKKLESIETVEDPCVCTAAAAISNYYYKMFQIPRYKNIEFNVQY